MSTCNLQLRQTLKYFKWNWMILIICKHQQLSKWKWKMEINTIRDKKTKIPEASLQELARVLWEKEHRRPRPTLRRERAYSGHVTKTPQQLSFANAHKQLHRVFVKPIFISNYISYSCVYKCCLFCFMNFCFENTNASGNFPESWVCALTTLVVEQFGIWELAAVTEGSLVLKSFFARKEP